MNQLPQSIIILAATSLLLLILPAPFVIIWRRRTKASWLSLFLGAAGFLLFARVLELGVHMVCIVSDNPISRTILGSTPLFVLYGAMMAGIFEEFGRYVFLRFAMKKRRTREDFVMYGIGHGGMEVWSVSLMSMASLLVIDVLLLALGAQGAEKLLDPAGTGTLGPTLEAAAGFGVAGGVVSVLERLICMVVHISLTVLVGYGVSEGKSRLYLPLAILAHAGVDVFAALYQRGAVGMWITECWLAAWAVLLGAWAFRLYRKLDT